MLKQNNLAEATTELGFPTETGLPVRREVELETGEIVYVESVVPEVMAQTLKSHFVTPGEKYLDNGNDLNGVVQNFNSGAATIIANKKYNFSFKIEGMNIDKLKSFAEDENMFYNIITVNTPNPEDSDNDLELFRLGLAIDEEAKLATISLNWDEYGVQYCDAYIYDEMIESLGDRVSNPEGYEGDGWYHVVFIEGDISIPSSVVISLEKIENPEFTFEDTYISSIKKPFGPEGIEILPSVNISGLTEEFEEIEVPDLTNPAITIELEDPQDTSGGQLRYTTDYTPDLVESILNAIYDSDNETVKEDVVVELKQGETSLLTKIAVHPEFTNVAIMNNKYGGRMYSIDVYIGDYEQSVSLNDLNKLPGFNIEVSPVE